MTTNTTTSPVHRYLACHAQPEITALKDLDTNDYARVLVIPCYDEPPEFLDDVLPADANDLLVILIVNAPDNAHRDARLGTVRLLEKLRGA
ncbi:MAG: hypothetical protein O7B25_07665, partial [Gammaproteobacteria bacterium]|nr:hypothetical protein [Gammaproteobacteria bacterium]